MDAYITAGAGNKGSTHGMRGSKNYVNLKYISVKNKLFLFFIFLFGNWIGALQYSKSVLDMLFYVQRLEIRELPHACSTEFCLTRRQHANQETCEFPYTHLSDINIQLTSTTYIKHANTHTRLRTHTAARMQSCVNVIPRPSTKLFQFKKCGSHIDTQIMADIQLVIYNLIYIFKHLCILHIIQCQLCGCVQLFLQ